MNLFHNYQLGKCSVERDLSVDIIRKYSVYLSYSAKRQRQRAFVFKSFTNRQLLFLNTICVLLNILYEIRSLIIYS